MLCIIFQHYQFVRTARAWDLASAAVNKVGYTLLQQPVDCDACKLAASLQGILILSMTKSPIPNCCHPAGQVKYFFE